LLANPAFVGAPMEAEAKADEAFDAEWRREPTSSRDGGRAKMPHFEED
jgi:hypothetical protein